MRILVYEHFTATGAATAGSLLAEGGAMLAAACEDFSRAASVEVVSWNDRIIDPVAAVAEAASSVDAAFIIGPETDDVLFRLCQAVEDAGGLLLGPSANAVRLTGDKLVLARHFEKARVRTPPCGTGHAHGLRYPVVCKPRDGAGSQATFLARDARELEHCLDEAHAAGFAGRMIVQTYVRGIAASVSFLLGPGQTVPLLPTRQLLSEDGRFHYLGCEIPLAADLAHRAISLAQRAVSPVAGLRGYVGVDLVLGDEPDGSDDHFIEINPRLTTSYLALRQLARTNILCALLQVLRGETARIDWSTLDSFHRFQLDGMK